MKEKPQIIKDWIAELRSGKYKQTRCMLQSEDGGYCCLGVLFKLCLDKGLVKPYKKFFREGTDILRGSGLQPEITEVTGISSLGEAKITGNMWSDARRVDLIVLNDKYEYDFTFIADYIERHWEAYVAFPLGR